ncbi:MAG: plasmid pRiA4b ORF-3 family protein [Pleurocapsa sp. CRU_1_2]|nr:plasmid pRiA4b ORF-3 family protein [Pleurocapsa sp. CRU_1_2]
MKGRLTYRLVFLKPRLSKRLEAILHYFAHISALPQLGSLIKQEKAKFFYTYDFGDSWEHSILVEKILPKETKISYPTCIKAKRACPPEDCGGAWGYLEFLEAIQNPNHPERESFLEWLEEDLDSEFCDLKEINQRLSEFETLAQHWF